MKLFLILSLFLLAACQEDTHVIKSINNGKDNLFCYNGVTYMKFFRGATVVLDQDSKIVKCEG